MTDSPFSAPTRRSERAPRVENGRYRFINPITSEKDIATRVTTFAKSISDMTNLMYWSERMVARGVGLRPDLAALAAADDSYPTLSSVARQAKDAAQAGAGATRGTAMHAACETYDRGESIDHLSPEWRADVQAYATALWRTQLTVVPEMIERTVYVPELELVGTLDRVYANPVAEELIGDLKTTNKIEYAWLDIAIQLACYAHASHYWDDQADEWRDMPVVEQQAAIVAHIKPGEASTNLLLIDIAAGWQRALLAAKVRQARRDAMKLVLSELIAPEAPTQRDHNYWLDQVERAESRGQLSGIWKRADAAGEWTSELTAAGQARLAALGG